MGKASAALWPSTDTTRSHFVSQPQHDEIGIIDNLPGVQVHMDQSTARLKSMHAPSGVQICPCYKS